MLSYGWPIVLVVLSNVVYQICAKSVPKGMDPLNIPAALNTLTGEIEQAFRRN